MSQKINKFSVLINSGAIIVKFNDHSNITGYIAEEIIGKNWFEVFIHEGNTLEILDVFTGLFYSDNPHWVYDNEIVCKDGTKKMIQFNNNIIKDTKDKPEYIFSTATEI